MKITLTVDDRTVLDAEEYNSFVFASMTEKDEKDEVGVFSSVRAELQDAQALVVLLIEKVNDAVERSTETTEVVQ